MVKVARKTSTTKSEQESYAAAAALTRRCWRALNTEGSAGSAATQDWRPTVWTHVFLCHLPKTLAFHGTLAPFWQYGFEHRHAREKRGVQVTMNLGSSSTTGKSGLEDLLSWDNLDLELWEKYGHHRQGGR